MSSPESNRDNPRISHQAQALADRLADLGFYRYANSRRITHLKAQFANKPTLWNPAVRRDYPADEERLAECGVKAFLRDIRRVLWRNGIRLRRIVEICGRTGYSIRIENVTYTLYSADDLVHSERTSSTILWDLTTRRTFAMINQLLMTHNADERLYSYGGWNDHWAFFLTATQYTLLHDSGLVPETNDFVLYHPDIVQGTGERTGAGVS